MKSGGGGDEFILCWRAKLKMSLTDTIMHSDAKCFKLTVEKLTVQLPDHRLQSF